MGTFHSYPCDKSRVLYSSLWHLYVMLQNTAFVFGCFYLLRVLPYGFLVKSVFFCCCWCMSFGSSMVHCSRVWNITKIINVQIVILGVQKFICDFWSCIWLSYQNILQWSIGLLHSCRWYKVASLPGWLITSFLLFVMRFFMSLTWSLQISSKLMLLQVIEFWIF